MVPLSLLAEIMQKDSMAHLEAVHCLQVPKGIQFNSIQFNISLLPLIHIPVMGKSSHVGK
jgi:hypothetical protein